ncbi:GNAT family N-acetyltransferase [Streptacidiphilus rugosus]|uniref:GNAT family N-acetyltransferase n=1 Tax=Streptacidiphilus rugosus TaxID=405783 RepID=UPI00055AD3C4|nr:GNAT family N-acetyltransferase [Streptacidiphilus rugosus]
MSVNVQSFDAEHASGEDLRAWYELAMATTALDYPGSPVTPYEAYVQQLCLPASYMGEQRLWVARADGELAGIATATFPGDENSDRAVLSVRVPAPLRGRGIGSGLLRAMLPEIRRRGCARVAGQLKAGSQGDAWADGLGFRTVSRRASHHLDLASADPELWQVPPAPGFELRLWADTAPDDLVESFARARGAIADSPADDSSYRHPDWTVDRVRQHEARMREIGESHRYAAAVEQSSGRVVGFTEIALVPDQWSFCHQEDTAVLPAFRGLGLGRAIKAGMARWLVADLPRLEQVHTMTAADNIHMIRVNAQLGYVTDHVIAGMEADLAALEARLAAGRAT